MIKTYLVQLVNLDKVIINSLSQYGTVDIICKSLEICTINTEEKNEKKLEEIKGVLAVEEECIGSFCNQGGRKI